MIGGLYTMSHQCDVADEPSKMADHAIHVLDFVLEAVPFAVGDLTNHVESVSLEPLCKITDSVLRRKECLGLVKESGDRFVHE